MRNPTISRFFSPLSHWLVLSLLLAACISLSHQAQAQVVVKPSDRFYVRIAGRVLNYLRKPISYATVRNRTTQKVAIADSGGNYSIVLSQYDTLEFRRVGYKTLFYLKDPDKNGNYYQDIYLEEEAYSIKEVTIFRKNDGRLNTMALNPEYHRPDRFDIQIGVRPEDRHEYLPNAAESPISYLYDQFSRRGIAARKLAVLKEQKRMNTLVSIRWNEDYVTSMTGLQGRDLAEFMLFCPMPSQFILTASDYELAAATLNCYRRFMND